MFPTIKNLQFYKKNHNNQNRSFEHSFNGREKFTKSKKNHKNYNFCFLVIR